MSKPTQSDYMRRVAQNLKNSSSQGMPRPSQRNPGSSEPHKPAISSPLCTLVKREDIPEQLDPAHKNLEILCNILKIGDNPVSPEFVEAFLSLPESAQLTRIESAKESKLFGQPMEAVAKNAAAKKGSTVKK
jgi:hypothetical protein